MHSPKSPEQTGLLDGYLTADELIEQLDISAETLKRWHRVGAGPPMTKVGRYRYYARDSVSAWLRAKEKKFATA
jgi:DNA-binding transcriptional MerR regulator